MNDLCQFLRASRHLLGRRIAQPTHLLLRRSLAFWIVLVAAPGIGQSAQPGVFDDRQIARSAREILSNHCYQCHGQDQAAREADLRLDAENDVERVFARGDFESSEAWRRITSTDASERMPPADHRLPLSAEQIGLLREWMKRGAPWSRHWSFEPVASPSVPPVKHDGWVRNPIDAFVLAQLEAKGLQQSKEASKETLLRRVSFDLIGLPPTPTEIDAFLADDSPDAYERVVERLLKSPHYGERMAIDWLDGARYADTNGYQNDFPRDMWLWRDWVIAAFNANMPFDQFSIEQLAGDLLPDPTQSQIVATAFNRNHRTVTESGSLEEEWFVENVVDRVETFGTVWLGLTVGCARCHDHKFDPISQRDFYSLYAFFNSIDEKGVYNEQSGNVPPLLKVPNRADTKRSRELQEQIVQVEASLKEAQAKDGERKAIKELEEKLREFRKQKEEHDADIPSVMVMRELPTPRPAYVLLRGRYDMPDMSQQVERAVPSFLPPLSKDAAPNRLALARWLFAKEHPLTSRVQVNRLWQHFFGTGFVRTTEHLGIQAEFPSHPALLDWLAHRFMESGWDIQEIQRLIVTSATYRQASDADAQSYETDPENRLLGRGPRFRLPAELIRDNALAISGLLNDEVGGLPVMPYQPEGLWDELAGAKRQEYKQDHGDKLYRRSLYIYRKRTVPHPAVSTFDAPSWEVCQIGRSATNTPLQSLALLNDTTYVEAARHLGERMIREGGADPDARLSHGFRLTVGRLPLPRELTVVRRALDVHLDAMNRHPEAANALLSNGESSRDTSLSASEAAAYMLIAGTLLNLDETMTRQ